VEHHLQVAGKGECLESLVFGQSQGRRRRHEALLATLEGRAEFEGSWNTESGVTIYVLGQSNYHSGKANMSAAQQPYIGATTTQDSYQIQNWQIATRFSPLRAGAEKEILHIKLHAWRTSPAERPSYRYQSRVAFKGRLALVGIKITLLI
jgi:hypothetical protein